MPLIAGLSSFSTTCPIFLSPRASTVFYGVQAADFTSHKLNSQFRHFVLPSLQNFFISFLVISQLVAPSLNFQPGYRGIDDILITGSQTLIERRNSRQLATHARGRRR